MGILNRKPSERPSRVYVFENELGRLKIGVSSDVGRRVDSIHRHSGVDVKVVYMTPYVVNAYELEKDCHNRFKDYNIYYEWFDLDLLDIVGYLSTLEFRFDKECQILNSDDKLSNKAKELGVSRQSLSNMLSRTTPNVEVRYSIRHEKVAPNTYFDGKIYYKRYYSGGKWVTEELKDYVN